jgi:hypothetical protein
MRLTVGPLPPAVYWRRRAMVLGGVLFALFLLAQACMSAAASPEGGNATSAPSSSPPTATSAPVTLPTITTAPTPPPVSQPAPDPSQTPVDPNACTDDEMLIIADADRTSFAAGTTVRLTIRIRNDSERTCRRDVGGDRRELYLRQGPGAASKAWSSRDCDAPTGSDVEELTPAFETEYWVEWNGRSSDSCDATEPAGELLPPGEYELVARLGTAYSEPLILTVNG